MGLRGTGVRIIVHEPANWDKGNLFGTIAFDRGGNYIIVKLSDIVNGNKLTTDLLEISPAKRDDTFKPLLQYYTVMVNGSLVNADGDLHEPFFYGSVTFD